jgi:hypothetical protein
VPPRPGRHGRGRFRARGPVRRNTAAARDDRACARHPGRRGERESPAPSARGRPGRRPATGRTPRPAAPRRASGRGRARAAAPGGAGQPPRRPPSRRWSRTDAGDGDEDVRGRYGRPDREQRHGPGGEDAPSSMPKAVRLPAAGSRTGRARSPGRRGGGQRGAVDHGAEAVEEESHANSGGRAPPCGATKKVMGSV